MQKYGRLVIKNIVLDSLVCSGDSLILDEASPRTHKSKIINESLYVRIYVQLFYKHFLYQKKIIFLLSILKISAQNFE